MKWLNGYKIRLMLIGIVAVMVLGDGSGKADFTFGTPTVVPNVNSSADDSTPSVSADSLTLYFASDPGLTRKNRQAEIFRQHILGVYFGWNS